jgi:hypothetical protein
MENHQKAILCDLLGVLTSFEKSQTKGKNHRLVAAQQLTIAPKNVRQFTLATNHKLFVA